MARTINPQRKETRQSRWTAIVTAGLAIIVAIASSAAAFSHGATQAIREWSAVAAAIAVILAAMTVRLALAMITSAGRYAFLRRVTDALPQAEFVIDGQGRVLAANAGAAPLLQGSPRPLDLLTDAIDGDDDQSDLELKRLKALARMGGSGRGEIRVRLRDATAYVFQVQVTPLGDPPGSALWSLHDVTAEREVNEVVLRERAGLDDFLDDVPVGLFTLDGEGRFVWANRIMGEWLGEAPERLTGQRRRLADFIVKERSAEPEGLGPIVPCDGVVLGLRGPDGQTLEMALHQAVTVLPDGGLRTRSMLRRIEGENRRSEMTQPPAHRFQRLFDIAPIGIAVTDPELRFIETNPSLDGLLMSGGEPLFRRELRSFVAPQDWPIVSRRLAEVAAGDVFSRPLEIHVNTPHDRAVALFAGRLNETDGARSGFILHFFDLTEQKNLEAQFAQSQKMQAVGQLAGGVAHDFNNLLTAMIGFCDLLLMRFRPGDQSFADIMQIKQNANRAASLVRQLLAFSRQQTLQPRVIDVGEVLTELSQLLNRLLGETIDLQLTHGRSLGPVKVDPGQLEQVIINLVVNARDAMTKGGTVAIRTENVDISEPIQEAEFVPPGSYILIEVADTGTGIPPEIVGRIFEPFFSTKDVGSGTGLGLSTVYGIVKQTGGFIIVDSSPGTGTTFRIYLPRHHAEPSSAPVPLAQAVDLMAGDLTGAGTILLVEDEAPVRMFTSRALRNKGYVVLEAKSAEMALEILEQADMPPDLIITDVMMPRMDGPTLVGHIREKLPTIRVIFISGYAEETFGEKLSGGDGLHFLPKPYSLKELAAKVKEIMAS